MNLLYLETEKEYKNYYINTLAKKKIYTKEKIRVYFSPNTFYHAFFETTLSHKDSFSKERAKYMNLIKSTIENPTACHWGWDRESKTYSPNSTVSLYYENFIVILCYRINKDRILKANFKTCYWKINMYSIKKAPIWKIEDLKI